MNDYIYGKNSCLELIKANKSVIKKVLLTKNSEIIELLDDISFEYKAKEDLDNIVKANSQGIICFIKEYTYFNFNDLISDDNNSLIVILDNINDPHNFGAICRTCEVSGCSGIIIPKDRSVGVNATVSKVSSGAVYNLKISQVVNLTNTIKMLKKQGYWIVGADFKENSKNYWDLDFKMKIALVIGSEGYGISRLVREECDFLAKIPMWGQINSLNASVSAALLIYEIRRQQNN